MGITQWALGDKNYNILENLESEYAGKYPKMSTSGGVFSDARHAAATSLMSDKLGGGVVGDTLANIGGFAREVPTFTSEALGLTPFGESWEDLKANAQAFNYPGNTSAADIYADIFSKYNANKGIPATNIGYRYGQAQGAHPHMMRFKQQQLMNRRKQQMQQKIQQAEAAQQVQQVQQVQQNIQTYGNRDRPNTGMNAPGAGKSQSPTGGDVSGTPFVRGGRVSYFDGGLASLWLR